MRTVFEQLVQEGMQRIPAQFRQYLEDVAITVERAPSPIQRRRLKLRRGGELLGLYEGTPRTARAYLPYRLPDKITVFQESIERTCGNDPECIREQVAHTVWHELAHALGFSERRVRALEQKRRKRRGPQGNP